MMLEFFTDKYFFKTAANYYLFTKKYIKYFENKFKKFEFNLLFLIILNFYFLIHIFY